MEISMEIRVQIKVGTRTGNSAGIDGRDLRSADLRGPADRVAARGGTLRVTGSADGIGVRAVLPCG